jgi:ubiquinone/menaquinone biosynthesis C-methylase UbiE
MRRTVTNIYELWRQYVHVPFAVRMRVTIRFLTCPFGAFLLAFHKSAYILDVGCGDGQLLHWLMKEPGTQRMGVGIDIDADKISHSKQANIADVVFRQQNIHDFPDSQFDGVCIAHVLYLIPRDQWSKLLSECFRVLKAGGTLAVMEVVDDGSWKSRLAHLQELISVYVTRMTQGEVVKTWKEKVYLEEIQKVFGGSVVAMRADDGYLHPHVLFVAKK